MKNSTRRIGAGVLTALIPTAPAIAQEINYSGERFKIKEDGAVMLDERGRETNYNYIQDTKTGKWYFDADNSGTITQKDEAMLPRFGYEIERAQATPLLSFDYTSPVTKQTNKFTLWNDGVATMGDKDKGEEVYRFISRGWVYDKDNSGDYSNGDVTMNSEFNKTLYNAMISSIIQQKTQEITEQESENSQTSAQTQTTESQTQRTPTISTQSLEQEIQERLLPMQRTLEQRTQRISTLQNKIEGYKTDISDLNSQIQDYEKQITDLRTQISQPQASQNQTTQTPSITPQEYETRIDALHEIVTKLRNLKNDYHTQIQNLEVEQKSSEKRIEALHNLLHKFRDYTAELKEQIPEEKERKTITPFTDIMFGLSGNLNSLGGNFGARLNFNDIWGIGLGINPFSTPGEETLNVTTNMSEKGDYSHITKTESGSGIAPWLGVRIGPVILRGGAIHENVSEVTTNQGMRYDEPQGNPITSTDNQQRWSWFGELGGRIPVTENFAIEPSLRIDSRKNLTAILNASIRARNKSK